MHHLEFAEYVDVRSAIHVDALRLVLIRNCIRSREGNKRTNCVVTEFAAFDRVTALQSSVMMTENEATRETLRNRTLTGLRSALVLYFRVGGKTLVRSTYTLATQEQTESEEKKERGEGGGGGERTHMRSPPLRNRPNSGLFPLSSSVFSSSEAYFEVSIRARKFWNGERAQCERKRERERHE